ncbi:MAG: hypothetical protein PHR25_00975 [Clostridia bacterium]|nr:hypothetical protein [Clostridia bacterium]MDD4375340.1 hypothetical protein [Clostridia bacterium]
MNNNKKWIVRVFLTTFILSIFFNGITNVLLDKLNIYIAFLVLLVMIIINIVFDIIGMAVATCEEAPFHAKAAKKHKGAREAIKLIRSKEKVTNFCNDIVGDVVGIVSGSLSALVSVNLSSVLEINIFIVSLLIGAIVASLTVGGKAIGKLIAIEKCNEILYMVGAVIHIFVPINAANTIDEKTKRKNEEKNKNN